MKIKSAGQTHIGMRRAQNQDHMLVAPELNLFVVADGMGGHRGGETASALTIETIGNYFRTMAVASKQNPIEKIKTAITTANQAVQAKAISNPELSGMGTTTTALFFDQDRLFVGQVGDSRCYLMRSEGYWQLTRDHSLVQEKLAAGLITRDQLKTDRMKNVITRSVGYESEVEVDVYEFTPQSGDTYVICSDGLSGMVDDSEIFEILQQTVFTDNGSGVEAAALRLIETANRNGGDDNVTVIVVKIG